jgi:rhamnulose-1-phosphate aldolase
MTPVDDVLAPVLADVRQVAAWMWQRGWVEATAGNLSVDVTDVVASTKSAPVRCDTSDLWLLASAAGSRFRTLAREPERGTLLVRIQGDGHVPLTVWDPSGAARPTSELPAHLSVHRALRIHAPSRRVVLHAHPTQLLALNHTAVGANESSLNRVLWSVLPEVKLMMPEGVALAPYRRPGSRDLAEACARAVRHHRVVVWDRHGCMVVEDDCASAFDLMDVVDKAARVYLAAAAVGHDPRGLTDEEVGALG